MSNSSSHNQFPASPNSEGLSQTGRWLMIGGGVLALLELYGPAAASLLEAHGLVPHGTTGLASTISRDTWPYGLTVAGTAEVLALTDWAENPALRADQGTDPES